jgi:hypothetical protein
MVNVFDTIAGAELDTVDATGSGGVALVTEIDDINVVAES